MVYILGGRGFGKIAAGNDCQYLFVILFYISLLLLSFVFFLGGSLLYLYHKGAQTPTSSYKGPYILPTSSDAFCKLEQFAAQGLGWRAEGLGFRGLGV